MQSTLSSAQIQEVRQALLGPHSDGLIDLISKDPSIASFTISDDKKRAIVNALTESI